jgi:hypothetical protein
VALDVLAGVQVLLMGDPLLGISSPVQVHFPHHPARRGGNPMIAAPTSVDQATIGRLMLRAATALRFHDICHRDQPNHILTPELQQMLIETGRVLLGQASKRPIDMKEGSHEEQAH